MRLKEYITEMSKEIPLDSGHTISSKALVKLKKDTNTFDEFMQRIQKKATLTKAEHGKFKSIYQSI